MSDQIYVDPSITAPVIKVGGECYQKVGGVPVAPNVSSVQGTFDDCGGCGEANCKLSLSSITFTAPNSGSWSVGISGGTPNGSIVFSAPCDWVTINGSNANGALVSLDSSGNATFTLGTLSSAPSSGCCELTSDCGNLEVCISSTCPYQGEMPTSVTITITGVPPEPPVATNGCAPNCGSYDCTTVLNNSDCYCTSYEVIAPPWYAPVCCEATGPWQGIPLWSWPVETITGTVPLNCAGDQCYLDPIQHQLQVSCTDTGSFVCQMVPFQPAASLNGCVISNGVWCWDAYIESTGMPCSGFPTAATYQPMQSSNPSGLSFNFSLAKVI